MIQSLLSLLVSLALLFSGADALPAQPESAVTYTLRNCAIEISDQRCELSPEAVLSFALGAEKQAAHLELRNGDDVLFPISAELTADAVRAAFGAGKNAYVFGADMIEALMADESPETESILQAANEEIRAFTCKAALIDVSPERMEEIQHQVQAIMLDVVPNTATETEIEIDGTPYLATRIEMDLDMRTSFALMDALMNADEIAEFQPLFHRTLDMYNLLYANAFAMAPAESFSALRDNIIAAIENSDEADSPSGEEFAAAMDAICFPLVWTIVEADGLSYSSAEMETNIEGISMTVNADASETADGGAFEMEMHMFDEADEIDLRLALNADYAGSAYAPDSIAGTMRIAVDENESLLGCDIDFSAAEADGLCSANCEIKVFEDDGEIARLGFRLSQTAEADASVTSAVALSADADGQHFGLSFDLNRAEAPFEDFLAGCENVEFTLDMDEESPAVAAVQSDAMRMTSDATRLLSDESVQALVGLLAAQEADDAEQGALPPEADAEQEAFDDEGQLVLQSFADIEDAAEVFTGALPKMKTPEGYALLSVSADADYLIAEYGSENSDYAFTMSCANYGAEDRLYYTKNGAQLSEAASAVFAYKDEGGSIYCASVFTADGMVDFYFAEPVDADAFARIMACLGD